ncbi:hypothetical protein [Nocardioides okcheonensis]|uniref:hypothetical protein n=1 Tax=Nocardioides okcheonensis TaxID=2894081 RepID=UPI001E30E531|nr:hypothetical protein [Nocardioides okcheonensis]UFN43496.1 hypothetical protein LN652_15785 [Nocardioides okcheonensis]
MTIDTRTPHVETDWSEAFLLELRLRGVDGRRIGAALAEVEAHCAESGESARSAFGDPVTYADDLDLAPAAPSSDLAREVATTGLGLVSMLLTLGAVAAWRTGDDLELTTGLVAVVALAAAGSALLVRFAEALLRALVRRWWVALVGCIAPIALFVAVLVLARQTLLTVPAVPALGAGVALLAVHTALALRGPDLSDPVIGPDEAGGAGTMREDAASRGLDRLGPWLTLVLTVVMALPLLLL